MGSLDAHVSSLNLKEAMNTPNEQSRNHQMHPRVSLTEWRLDPDADHADGNCPNADPFKDRRECPGVDCESKPKNDRGRHRYRREPDGAVIANEQKIWDHRRVV